MTSPASLSLMIDNRGSEYRRFIRHPPVPVAASDAGETVKVRGGAVASRVWLDVHGSGVTARAHLQQRRWGEHHACAAVPGVGARERVARVVDIDVVWGQTVPDHVG